MRQTIHACLLATVLSSSANLAFANPIPFPVPASMPLEQMELHVDGDGHVEFSGRFTFDFIPSDVAKMLFPLAPADGGSVSVAQDGVPVPWSMSTDLYPTVLPEYPQIPMFEWAGPFPESGAVFTVEYEHKVFRRGDADVLFYSLGTGKYFPTYDKVTTALLDVFLPSGSQLLDVLLDDTKVPQENYSFVNGHLDLRLESQFGPFTQDLIVVYVPGPATPWLLLLGAAATVAARRRRRAFPARLPQEPAARGCGRSAGWKAASGLKGGKGVRSLFGYACGHSRQEKGSAPEKGPGSMYSGSSPCPGSLADASSSRLRGLPRLRSSRRWPVMASISR